MPVVLEEVTAFQYQNTKRLTIFILMFMNKVFRLRDTCSNNCVSLNMKVWYEILTTVCGTIVGASSSLFNCIVEADKHE